MSRYVEQAVTWVSEQDPQQCRSCLDHTLIPFSITAVTSAGMQTIGGTAICHRCGWSPYARGPASKDGGHGGA